MPEQPGWARAVFVRDDPILAAELGTRLAAGSGASSVGVTDLVDARRAYWRSVGPPVAVSEERRTALETGRRLHRWLGGLFPDDALREVRVRRDGIAARIDVLADVPVELKTGGTAVVPDDLSRSRPEHVEQLAMYCALAGRTQGRIVHCRTGGDAPGAIRTTEVDFRGLDRIEAEAQRRARALRHAWAAADPRELPACAWRGRGCEFEDAGVCDCDGREPAPSPTLLERAERVAPREDLDRQLEARRGAAPPPTAGTVERFRELVYPRRAYFDRTERRPPDLAPAPSRPVGPDLYARLVDAVESGPLGEVASVPRRSADPEEDVPGFRGVPYLVRTSRAWGPVPVGEVVARYPQYALELGSRCAVTGTRTGRVILGAERAAVDAERLRVLEFRFDPVTAFARFVRGRTGALVAAVRDRTPDALPACPPWMTAECPYREVCGCAADLDHR